jgi:hypothetical protein
MYKGVNDVFDIPQKLAHNVLAVNDIACPLAAYWRRTLTVLLRLQKNIVSKKMTSKYT